MTRHRIFEVRSTRKCETARILHQPNHFQAGRQLPCQHSLASSMMELPRYLPSHSRGIPPCQGHMHVAAAVEARHLATQLTRYEDCAVSDVRARLSQAPKHSFGLHHMMAVVVTNRALRMLDTRRCWDQVRLTVRFCCSSTLNDA